MKKDLAFLKNLYIPHRGLHNYQKKVPENSMLAFKEALKNKLPIELDLHLLKDGQVVVFHDDNLERMTGINKKIKNCTYDEIKDLKLLNTNETIPLFEDVLKLVDGQVLLDIELKYDLPIGKLETKVCEFLDNYHAPFVIKSFHPLIVRWFKKNRPHYIRGQLVGNPGKEIKLNYFKKVISRNMLLNFLSKPDFISIKLDLLPNKKIVKYQKKNYPILIWTIETEEDLKVAKKYGDSFIYENITIKK